MEKRHKQGHPTHVNIPPLSNCKDTREQPSSLHNSKHTNHIHTTRVQNTTLYSERTLHTLNNTVAKGLNEMPPCAKNHCSTRYEQSFRPNKHTHTNQNAATDQHSNLKMNNTALRMATHPNGQGLTLDLKLTYSTHIHNIS